MNRILTDHTSAASSAAVVHRLEDLEKRLETGEAHIVPAADLKVVRYALQTAATEAREPGTSFQEYAVLTKYLLQTTIIVLVLQLALAISGFFGRSEAPGEQGKSSKGAV